MKLLVVLFSLILITSKNKCMNKAGSSLKDIEFKINPYISHVGGEYYLVYQINEQTTKPFVLVRILYNGKHDGKAFYYFSAPISHKEFGQIIKRNLKEDNFVEYAKKDEVYWLNKDNSVVKLIIVKE